MYFDLPLAPGRGFRRTGTFGRRAAPLESMIDAEWPSLLAAAGRDADDADDS